MQSSRRPSSLEQMTKKCQNSGSLVSDTSSCHSFLADACLWRSDRVPGSGTLRQPIESSSYRLTLTARIASREQRLLSLASLSLSLSSEKPQLNLYFLSCFFSSLPPLGFID